MTRRKPVTISECASRHTNPESFIRSRFNSLVSVSKFVLGNRITCLCLPPSRNTPLNKALQGYYLHQYMTSQSIMFWVNTMPLSVQVSAFICFTSYIWACTKVKTSHFFDITFPNLTSCPVTLSGQIIKNIPSLPGTGVVVWNRSGVEVWDKSGGLG